MCRSIQLLIIYLQYLISCGEIATDLGCVEDVCLFILSEVGTWYNAKDQCKENNFEMFKMNSLEKYKWVTGFSEFTNDFWLDINEEGIANARPKVSRCGQAEDTLCPVYIVDREACDAYDCEMPNLGIICQVSQILSESITTQDVPVDVITIHISTSQLKGTSPDSILPSSSTFRTDDETTTSVTLTLSERIDETDNILQSTQESTPGRETTEEQPSTPLYPHTSSISALTNILKKNTTALIQVTTEAADTMTSDINYPYMPLQDLNDVPQSAKNGVVQCPALPKLTKAHIIGFSRWQNSVIVITCKHGSVFPEGGVSRTVICLASGQWNSPITDCVALTCPESEDGIIAADGQQPPKPIQVGYTAWFRCIAPDAAYCHGQTEFAKACVQVNDKASWLHHCDNCAVARCPPVPLLQNATLVGDYVSDIGATVWLMCKAGHRFSDGNLIRTIVCQPNRTWTAIGDCKLKLCPNIATNTLVQLNTTSVTYGTVVKGTCPEGYHFQTGPTSLVTECTAELRWSVNLTDCILVQCEEPLTPVNATAISLERDGASYNYNATITYQCDIGLRFYDGLTWKAIRCMEDGNWNDTLLSCKESRCEPVPHVDKALPNTSFTDEGTIVKYTCLPGHVTDNVTTSSLLEATCLQGQWIIENKRCTVASCASLEQPNASLNTTSRLYGTRVLITCDEGFRLASGTTQQVVTCSGPGQWDDDVDTECHPVDCGPPPLVSNSMVSILTNTTYRGIIHYQCLRGYWFERSVSSVSITCSSSGDWADQPKACVPVKCLPLSLWNNIEPYSADVYYGAVVNYTCVSNKDSSISTSLTSTQCTADGTWLPEVVACPVSSRAVKMVPKESKHSSIIGYTTICLLTAIVVLALLLDLPTFYTQSQILLKNIGAK